MKIITRRRIVTSSPLSPSPPFEIVHLKFRNNSVRSAFIRRVGTIPRHKTILLSHICFISTAINVANETRRKRGSMKKKRKIKKKKKKKENVKRTEKKKEKKGIKREKTKERRGNVDEAVLNRTQRRCHDEKRAVLFRMVAAAAAAAAIKLPRLRELLDQTRFSTSAFLRIHDPAERFSRFITVSTWQKSEFQRTAAAHESFLPGRWPQPSKRPILLRFETTALKQLPNTDVFVSCSTSA